MATKAFGVFRAIMKIVKTSVRFYQSLLKFELGFKLSGRRGSFTHAEKRERKLTETSV